MGTHIDVSHTAATPVGMTVTASVGLVAVDGRRLRFRVACRDDAETIGAETIGAETIGEGWHDRAIIDRARFAERLALKRAGDRNTRL